MQIVYAKWRLFFFSNVCYDIDEGRSEMMFTLAGNEKIGQYLMGCIKERYKNYREFCREYLKDIGEETGKEQLQKMSNRLSQIKKGKKEIQLYDLPVF